MTARRVLLVDDEPAILDGYRRHLHRNFEVTVCSEPVEALRLLNTEETFAVVVSDYRMPVMNGVDFLKEVRRLHPTTTRVMLTGQADHEATLDAINHGNIYRFLQKPCPPTTLSTTVEDAVELHQLVTAEKELIEGTLRGAVGALTELVGLASPFALSRASQVRDLAVGLAEELELEDVWTIELAGSLSQIGCMTLTDDIAEAGLTGLAMNDGERRMYETHPATAERLLGKIPRLDGIAAMVGAQFVGGLSDSKLRELRLDPMLSNVFFLSAAFAERAARSEEAIALSELMPDFPEPMMEALAKITSTTANQVRRRVSASVGDLFTGMIAHEEIKTVSGVLLLSEGHELTGAMLERIRNFHERVGVVEPMEMISVVSQ